MAYFKVLNPLTSAMNYYNNKIIIAPTNLENNGAVFSLNPKTRTLLK